MDDLIGLIATLVEAWKTGAKKRASIGSAQRPASPALGSSTASNVPQGRPAPATRPLEGSDSGVRAGSRLETADPVARAPEAGLVRALFGTPQSLVAAFIVAEVLAKPVALREP